MVRVKFGDKSFTSKKAAVLFIRHFLDKHKGDGARVDASTVHAWLGPLIRNHAEAARKTAQWTGRVVVDRRDGWNCVFLVKHDGSREGLSLSKSCVDGSVVL